MEEQKMKLEDLQHANVLARPADNKRTIPDGAYNGEMTNAEFVERDSQYSEDGKRVVLNIKVEVEDDEGEVVDLYIAPNYTWSKRGSMIKILEKLGALPAPGESIDLDELVGIPVQVIVENIEKDDETYSNIVSIKRIKTAQSQSTIQKKSITKKPITKKPLISKRSAMEEALFGKKYNSNDEPDDLFAEAEPIEVDGIFEELFGED